MKKKRAFRKMFFILLALILILILLISINLKIWKYLEKREIKMISVPDRCSILFNNLLHSIKDESSCENYCRSECIVREMKYYKIEFTNNLDSCNICNCYC